MEDLLYQRDIQFGRGEQAATLNQSSTSRLQQQQKQALALQLRNDIKGSRHMSLDHFRTGGVGKVFFTLPLRVMDNIPLSLLHNALTIGDVSFVSDCWSDWHGALLHRRQRPCFATTPV